jgi:hypothetical protein
VTVPLPEMGVVLVLVSTCVTGWYPEIADFESENTIR